MQTSLYERLGRAEGIDKIVGDVLDRHWTNPLIRSRFEVVADRAKLHRMAVAFFAAGSGGPEDYPGRDMLTAHRGMNISEQELVAAIDDVLAALAAQGIDEATRVEVLGILYGLKGEIVRV